MSVIIRSFRPEDQDALLEIWADTLYRDPVSPDRFRTSVLLDPNHTAESLLVAEVDGQPVGLLVGRIQKLHTEIEYIRDKAYITAMFVAPQYQRQGIGSQLLNHALDWFRSQGKTMVLVSPYPYTRHYFTPGVDVNAYAGGHQFLKKHGFVDGSHQSWMSLKLLDFRIPPEIKVLEARLAAEGIRVQAFEHKYLTGLLDFLNRVFPGDWPALIRERVERKVDNDETWIVLDGETVIGYAQYEAERFGPFGVSDDYRGRSIGTVLFYRTLQRMKAKGRKSLWLAWTGGAAQRFYERHGLTVDRDQVIMKKEL
ncbi:MAG: GCN5-related N-acetyltransferase [Symbiobacteriaceae bacterium]|jgi:GNAT superfamily N-acetyltransferase|nr:GCN5-related N-acetyltransferase [Symbiobacteriaceae bacterium]